MSLVVSEEVNENSPRFASNLEDCGGCGKSPDECGLFIDGRLHGQSSCSHLCAKCFIRMGEGVGWGKGQLYARQPNKDWRMVAGFPPKEDP